MEAALFTCSRGHKKHLLPKLTGNINVEDSIIQFNKDVTRWQEV
jgi:hypothetical protein